MINRRQSTEYNGIWRLPTSPADELQLNGILRYMPHEGFELEIIGSFSDLPESILSSHNPVIIQGTSSEGEKITLYKCFKSNSSFGPNFQTSKYKPLCVFIGAHFVKEPTFNKLYINYSYLDEWVNISGFDISTPTGRGEFSMKYKIPEDITINLDENYGITITHSVRGPNLNMVQKNFSIEQTTYIMICSKNETPITKYHDLIIKIRNFLSFGVGRPVYPLAISGKSEEYFTIHNDKKIFTKIEIYCNNKELFDEVEHMTPYDMLFIFKDISESFELFIRNWFNRYEVLSPVFDLYFSNFYTSKMYVETQFLNSVQAVESYHRRKETTNKFDIVPEKHNERMIKIISFAPIEHMDWLLTKLKYSNEVNLGKRLKEIISLHADIAEIYIGNKTQQKKFITKVVTNRNYLTHFDKDKEAEKANGETLLILIEQLNLIIKSCLLEEIGMSRSEIKTILERCKPKSFLSWDFISWD